MSSDVTISVGKSEVMKLEAALLVYRGPRNVFVTAHEVAGDGPCELRAGVPLTRESAVRMLDGLGMSLSYRGLVPERVLAIAPGMLAWWCPPGKRTTWFECSGEKGGDLIGNRHGVSSHPGLVFAAAAGKWYVFAARGNARPGPDAKLYRAPYFNVWADSGVVCDGNVRLPDSTGPEAIEGHERAFFDSRFTHPNPGFKVRFKGGGYALWRSLLDGKGKRPFPAAALVPANLTLAQLVRRLIEGKRHDD